MKPKQYPFEASQRQLVGGIDRYVDSVFEDISSEFLVLPKGPGFIPYSDFEAGYEILKRHSGNFRKLTAETVLPALAESGVVLLVVRTILGFTPSEWAHVATEKTGVEIPQGVARSLDRKVRISPARGLVVGNDSVASARVMALIETACDLIAAGGPVVDDGCIHRLAKADTGTGLAGVRALATLGAPYAMLLYERFLGRPFAGHRDSVSELVGDVLESAIEKILHGAGITYRKTKRAEKLPGFDQAPDFIIPSEFSPQVVIEAKISEDDGTARDKVTRVQHLEALSRKGMTGGKRRFEVIACIGGRGFRVRREDMRKLLLATDGKVYTARTLQRMTTTSRLSKFVTA